MKGFAILVLLFPAVASADAALNEYRARRNLLAECRREKGIDIPLPSETPSGSMREALASVQAMLLECNQSMTVAGPVHLPPPAVEEHPPTTEARPPEAPQPVAATHPRAVPPPVVIVPNPVPVAELQLQADVRETLADVFGQDPTVPDDITDGLVRSLQPLEQAERGAVLECVEEKRGAVRGVQVPRRRLRRLREVIRNCVSPPEPEATPEQISEVAQELLAGGFGALSSVIGPTYSAALDGVGFVDSYPARWREAGGRQLVIKNYSRRCYLEVRLDGRSVTMVRGGEPLVARVEGRADLIPVVPPSATVAAVVPDDEDHDLRVICNEGTVDFDGPEDRTVNAMGQPVVVAASGPVRPTGYRRWPQVHSGYGPPIEIRDTGWVRLNQHR